MESLEIRDTLSEVNGVFEINGLNGGWQVLFKFDNGYGASVIKSMFSYGIELAVIKFNENNDWSLCYETEITNDVIGHLNKDDLLLLLERIKNL